MACFLPTIRGCHTFGQTKEEALVNLKDAVMLYLEDEIENQSMKAVITVVEVRNKSQVMSKYNMTPSKL